jgi:AcrR family transcriptional regulator
MPARTPEYMENRREHIVSATIECLKRLGLVGTSLSDICEEAQISRGALYIHFASKEEILDAVVQRQSAQSLQRMSFDSVASLKKVLEAQVRFVTSSAVNAAGHVELEMLMASRLEAELAPGMRQALSARFKHLNAHLRKLRDAGLLKPGVDTSAAAHAIDSFLLGLFTSSLAKDRSAAAHLTALRLILSAILPD